MSKPLRLGDRVTVIRTPNYAHVGFQGRLRAVDMESDILDPYHVSDGRGRAVWASTVHRSRIQYPELPYRAIIVCAALVAVSIAALVGYGRHETRTEPAPAPTWVVEYGPTELIAPWLPPEKRAGHTDRDGERVPFLGEG